ncbi:MAG: cytochrome P450 [Deltaproteobacteria bacterium]|nr:cytochrome P450 [Deltaproteobacteria bacterium]
MAFVFNPMDPEFLQDPYPTYARLRQEHPVYRHPGGFWAVSRYDDVVRVLRDAEAFSSEAMGGSQPVVTPTGDLAPTSGALIGQDPPEHTRQRAIVSRGFTPRRIADLEGHVRTLARELVDDFVPKGECDLVRDLANPLPVAVIAELLGLDPNRRDDFKRWSNVLIVGSTQAMGPGGREAMLEVVGEFGRYMAEVVKARRADPGDDLVSILIHSGEDESILGPEQVTAFASLLLAAGSETTSNLVANSVLTMLTVPGLWDRVKAEPALVPQMLEESVRRNSPVQLLARLCKQDTEVGGVEIPRGSIVMPLLGSANRDETRFADPDRFDLERDTQGHVGFGYGNHFCLGAALARLEARGAVEEILARLESPRLATDRVEMHGSFLVHGPKSLPLTFDA